MIPQLQPGNIIVIDNATFHKGQSIQEVDSNPSAAANDNLYGFGGDDLFYGGKGEDAIRGGDGSDTSS